MFKENAAELLERKSQLDLALNNMTHGLCMFDARKRLVMCNERYAAMYGLDVELTKPGTEQKAIIQYLVDKKTFVESPKETFATINAIDAAEDKQIVKALCDGRLIAISHQSTADGGWVAIHEDITERQKAEAHIVHLARHDYLTDLPNRVFFREELGKNIAGNTGWTEICNSLS